MIQENSRYTKTHVDILNGSAVFKMRKRFEFNTNNALIHQFTVSDRLDGLALQYYQNPQLWWVILEANPQFRSELDIPYGTDLVIPSLNEVRKCLRY